MRVLLTTDWNPTSVNGVVTSVNNLKKGLEDRGHEVRVLTLSNTQHSYIEEDYYYMGSANAQLIYPGLRVRTTLSHPMVKEILSWNPDIVHSNCEFSSFFPAWKISHHLHIPLVHTYHTVYEDYTHYFCPSARVGRFAVKEFSKFIAGRTDCVITPTEKVKQLLLDYNVTQRLAVIPTGISCERFEKKVAKEAVLTLKHTLGIPEDYLVLLFVGRLSKEKNAEELLSYMSKLKEKPVFLLIVGDGPYGETLKAEAEKLELSDQVLFTGMIPQELIPNYYKLGDLFTNASTSETQGLTYIEAVSSGLPLLCRADSCLDGVVYDGENGWQYHTEDDFMEHINWCLEHKEQMPRMSQRSREIGKNYSVPVFAEKVESLYEELIEHYIMPQEDTL